METVGYRLTAPIGAGAFGVVWEARDRKDRPVALKFMDCREGRRDLINAEVRVLRALSEVRHPHIIKLEGVHACERHLVLVMERADGNLADLNATHLEQHGKSLPLERVLDLLGQAADTLDYLAGLKLPGLPASGGMQHCDVKPGNLLVMGDCLKVADFGLCAGNGWRTQKGTGWRGTWPYAAPELYRGRPALGTDQFALAVTFCQMVMGDRVFWPGARPDVPPAGPPVDLTKAREREVPVLARALCDQPGYRYPSCAAFIAALRKANTPSRPSKRFRRLPPRTPCPG
jgi:serine/threonine-protein kinase